MKTDKYEICLRLNPEEAERLKTDAARYGLSMAVYLRRLIMGTEVKARPSEGIKKLRLEIYKTSNNINQIARSVHAGLATKTDAKRGLYRMDKVYELLHYVLR